VSAVHQALIENGLRRNVSLVVDSGEVLEGHDAAVLVGNGADAVCPWMLYELAKSGLIEGVSGKEAEKNVETTLVNMMKKVMSKMGVTSLEGFRGARLFEAVGIHPEITDYYLAGMPSRVGGIKLQNILDDLIARSAEGGEALRPNKDKGAYNKQIIRALTASGEPGSDRGVF
jgi:glutamate synthase domain-containing protein 2